ncbi:MAG: ATP-binding protein [Candidatus Nomurabacteria bacterium]|jgi:predicted AAA+ superfamily ATPase|nr:ATP-binding protein [Candidatus Nomurabacteria bacterium]
MNTKLIKREEYLKKLRDLKDEHIIKVISGVRRSGKSSLLALFKRELLRAGVAHQQIQSINFEEAKNINLSDWLSLHRHLEKNLVPHKMNYIFLDELQLVDNFEKMIDSLFVKPNVDLYVTGSNAYFLSGEWATLLSGRYMEIKMLPFSFAEYVEMLGDDRRQDEAKFFDFLRNGGFPQSVEIFKKNISLGIDYLTGVFNTVAIKDILTRKGANDPDALENVLKFVFDNISKPLSPKKIADYMASNYRSMSSRTIEAFLTAAKESFVLYDVDRFNIKGKELLQTQQKYYLVDTGLRQVLLARDQQFDTGRALENVVYLELLRRGYQVWTGKTKSGKEVDFVAKTNTGIIEYYQVTETMRGETTRERELSALQNIDDNNTKIVLSLDPEWNNYDGIQQKNVISWLLDKR